MAQIPLISIYLPSILTLMPFLRIVPISQNSSTHQLKKINPRTQKTSTHKLKNINPQTQKHQSTNSKKHQPTNSKLINPKNHKLINPQTQKLKLLFLFYNNALFFVPFQRKFEVKSRYSGTIFSLPRLSRCLLLRTKPAFCTFLPFQFGCHLIIFNAQQLAFYP